MEERVINILLDIKADIGGIKNRLDQVETNLGGRMDRLEAEVSELKSDVAEIKEDMSEVKTTVNALAEGLLEKSDSNSSWETVVREWLMKGNQSGTGSHFM